MPDSPSGDEARDPRSRSLDELWSDVVARWSDEAAHHAFLEECRQKRRLDEAARRYLEASRRPDPYRAAGGTEEIAQKKLKAVATLAMVELEGSRREREAKGEALRARRSMLRWVFVLWVIAGLAAFMLHR